MIINNSQIAYKIGFSSAFESNSNEILQRRRYEIADLSNRELKKVFDAFHKGYFECQQLIHKVNMDNMINVRNSIYDIIFEDYANILRSKGYII